VTLDDDDRTTVARRGRRQQGGELLEKKGVRHEGQVAHINDMVGGARPGQESKYAMLKA
jgi:hypothetical protein